MNSIPPLTNHIYRHFEAGVRSTARRRQLDGFSLIELLVTISIIAILSAMLFPAMIAAKGKAVELVCANNERQLGMAMMQYSADNDDQFPSGVMGRYGYAWAGQIYNYVNSARAYSCYADPTVPADRNVGGKRYTMYQVSYAYNCNLASSGLGSTSGEGESGGQISQMTSMAKTVLLYEVTASQEKSLANDNGLNVANITSPNEAGGSSDGSSWLYSPAGNGLSATTGALDASGNAIYLKQATGYMGGSERQAVDIPDYYTDAVGRHNGGSNFLFADGHTRWLRGDRVSTGRYWTSGPFQTTPTTKQDQQAQNECAGTQSSENWAATFCPV